MLWNYREKLDPFIISIQEQNEKFASFIIYDIENKDDDSLINFLAIWNKNRFENFCFRFYLEFFSNEFNINLL